MPEAVDETYSSLDFAKKTREDRVALYRRVGLQLDAQGTEDGREKQLQMCRRCLQDAEKAGDGDYCNFFEAVIVFLTKTDSPRQITLIKDAMAWAKEKQYSEDYFLTTVLAIFLLLDEHPKTDESLKLCLRARELKPQSVGVLFWLGRIYLQRSEYNDALLCFDEVIERNPSDSYSMYWIGSTLYRMGHTGLAEECFDRAHSVKTDASHIVPPWLGKAILARREAGTNARWNAQAADIRPDYFDPMLGKASVFRYLNQYDQVVQWCERVFEAEAADAECMYEKGIAYCLTDQNDSAIEWFLKVLELQPSNHIVMYWLGVSYADNKDYESALQWYERSLQINPGDSECLMRKGISLGLSGKYDEAIATLKSSHSKDPYNIGVLQCLGITYSLKGEYREALNCYGEAHQLNPRDNTILYKKGKLHHILGEYEEALHSFDEALKIYPDDYEALLYRSRTLQKIREPQSEREA